jgi:3-deoxy-D-manno-octulosonic-acid transferase
MIVAAAERSIPVAVIGGTVRPDSPRLWGPVRRVARSLHASIRFVGAVSDEDARRWARMGVPESAITTTGDPRHDQVVERTADVRVSRGLSGWAAGRPVFVAGSVEGTDHQVVLDAFRMVLRVRPECGLIVVPHEPAPAVVAEISNRARLRGISAQPWPGAVDAGMQVLVVSGTGLLNDLYLLARCAYVGGGFRRRGLHAVIEPAALGLPVCVGPETAGMRDVERLLAGGGGKAIPSRRAAEVLGAQWLEWLSNDDARARAGLAARATIMEGAAARTAQSLLRLVG